VTWDLVVWQGHLELVQIHCYNGSFKPGHHDSPNCNFLDIVLRKGSEVSRKRVCRMIHLVRPATRLCFSERPPSQDNKGCHGKWKQGGCKPPASLRNSVVADLCRRGFRMGSATVELDPYLQW
jgi:hypothetical protein